MKALAIPKTFVLFKPPTTHHNAGGHQKETTTKAIISANMVSRNIIMVCKESRV